jgi:hypothetical protein
MNKKLAVALVGVISLATLSLVYASYPLWGNMVEHTVSDYTLTLAVTSNGLEVTCRGNLTYMDTGVPGKTITIFHCNQAGDPIEPALITNTTDTNGFYTVSFNETTAAVYRYKPRTYVP